MDNRLVILGEAIHNAMVDFFIDNDAEWSRDLAGGCAVGSWFLQQEAKKRLGINIDFHCNGNHAWNEFDCHIYDVTATQYGAFDKVFVLHKNLIDTAIANSWHRAMYLDHERSSIEEINQDWPRGQRPNNFKIEWLGQFKAQITFRPTRFL
jgi:hypothetical protein